MTDPFSRVRELARRRNRLKAAYEQAQFELRQELDRLRATGISDDEIEAALTRRPPRLVKMPPREPPPPRADLTDWFDSDS